MTAVPASSPSLVPTIPSERQSRLERLAHAIDHAGHYLPSQGPITVFVHHNTLHAFEEFPFEDAVRKAGRMYGCQPYLSEERYRKALIHGRIRPDDLTAALRDDLAERADEPIAPRGTRQELRLEMLRHPLRTAPEAELRWFVAETDALRRMRPEAPPALRDQMISETRHWIMRDVRGAGPLLHHGAATHNGQALTNGQSGPHDHDLQKRLADLFRHFGEKEIECWTDETWESFTLQALWRICRDGVHGVRTFFPPPPGPVRHRDLLLEATGQDSDLLVNDLLIRFCAAFLDQGFAHWALPRREAGFYQAFCSLYRQPLGPPDAWLRGLRRELARLQDGQVGPLESILESLELLGVPEHEWDHFLAPTLLGLRGWAGMVRQIEERGDRVAYPIPPGSQIEYLAVRLVLERFALAHVARQAWGFEGPLSELRHVARARIEKHHAPGVEQRAFLVFQLAQVVGWSPRALAQMSKSEWSALVEEIESFNGLERRRIFHLAYERRYTTQALDALAVHARRGPRTVAAPRFQAVFCIDDREESFRRHLEELEPNAQTFSAAGFFAVPMYYRGAADAHFIPLCPVIIIPQHYVTEQPVYSLEDAHRRRARTRRLLGWLSHRFHVGSRTFAGGTVLTAGLGVLASAPLVARILFPRLVSQIRQALGTFVQPPAVTQLRLERSEPVPGPDDGHLGLTVEEMANAAERLLRDLGLTSNFAKLVFIFGHGSSSLNNPHLSAYGCGACSGAAGGPNARAIAQILNDIRVRDLLAKRGLTVPATTWFIGGYHNTCNDHLTWFDLDRLPHAYRRDFEADKEILDRTCERNAHERCRRFMSAPLTLTFEDALRHVEGRSEDLGQTRPELGHVNNALTYVGRRARTRGLFMDRRAFLNDYDPTQDDAQSTILARILAAAIPVCAGISLEYFFSHVDPAGYGCGTKLPHNVASLLGVMDGAASDLRTGLPWQMVEIHEPIRGLFVIETTPEAMLSIMDRNAAIGQLCRNGWIQLAVLSPDSPEIHLFRHGRFERYQPETHELPRAASSVDWYRGWREQLDFAEIEA